MSLARSAGFRLPLIKSLNDVADRIRDQELGRRACKVKIDGPRRYQQHVKVSQFLRGDAAEGCRHVPCSIAPELAAGERREELDIEPRIVAAQLIVRHRRTVVAEELLGEASSQQSFAQVPFVDSHTGRNGYVGVARHQPA